MLDETGFKKKTYAVLVDEMELKAQELFGETVNLSPRSFLGILIPLMAWFFAMLWEDVEDTYNSGFPAKAEGVQLDGLTPFFATKRNNEMAANVSLQFTGTPLYVIEENTRFETKKDIEFFLTEDVILDTTGMGAGIAYCSVEGEIGNVDAGTIVIQSEPSADVTSVTNLNPAVGGQDYEGDVDLLERVQNSTGINGYATPDAIIAAVRNIQAVRSANIKVNRTNTIVDGIPEKSFQVFTLGGDSQEIAEAIYSKMAGGLQPFGSTYLTVYDDSGNAHKIGHTPAIIVDVYIEVSVKTNKSFDVMNGNEQIQEEIVKVIGGRVNGVTYSGLNMGESVIRFQIEKAIGKVEGVVDAAISVGRGWDSLEQSNLDVESNEVAQTTNLNISVVEYS